MSSEHVDTVVVGSGFGGAVVAWRLADARQRVVVLERGKKWPPGSFPRRPHEIQDSFWDPSRGKHGLFNVWSFRNIGAVVSSGLGGGSLIYANVLIRKDEKWFVREDPSASGYECWPVTRADLDPHYENVEKMLAPQPYPFDVAPYATTPKTRAMREAAEALARSTAGQAEWSLPPLAIAFCDAQGRPRPGEPLAEAVPNLHGCSRSTCRLCGECNLGCNYGSKHTLDLNYLSRAERAGADIRTRIEVRTIRPLGPGGRDGYEVGYVDHRDERTDTRSLEEKLITCRRLVLAAGTLGSTYLMLRNRANFPGLSDRLGHALNGNGDLLGLVLDARGLDKREKRVLDSSLGPVITSALRIADELDGNGARGRGFYVEDAGHPQFLDWLADGSNVPGILRKLKRFVRAWVRMRLAANPTCDLGSDLSDLFGEVGSRSWLPLLGMGREAPQGRAYLNDGGYLSVDWSIDRSSAYFERVRDVMHRIADALHGKFENNPLWYLGRVITVHPLGGCPMGRNREEGVVNSTGEVFGYPGFCIADGSVLPGPVGPNPALTIAACADLFAEHMLGA